MLREDPTVTSQAGTPSAHQDPAASLDGVAARESRAAIRTSIPRGSITNLNISVETVDATQVGVSLRSAANVVKHAIESPAFRVYLERALSSDGRLDSNQARLVFPDAESRAARLDALVRASLAIVENGVGEFQRQSEGMRSKQLALKDSEVTLYKLATHQKIAGAPVREFVDAFIADPKKRDGLVGLLRTCIKESTAAALVSGELTVREHGTSQRQIINIRALHLPFFNRPESSDPHEKFDTVRIALGARTQDPARVREFLLAVNEIPRMPLEKMREDYQLQLTRRMQRAVAGLLIRHREDPIGEDHFKTVAIIKDIFSARTVLFHPYHNNNDAEIVDQIYRSVKAGQITIAAASCPNYSGNFEKDPKTNAMRWEYDFETLGTDTGFVAERGLDYVLAWHDILSRHFGKENVRFEHFEGTFEVAKGFKSKSQELSHAEAVARLAKSGEAVKDLYESRGITLIPRLTSDVIPDSEFIERKERRAEEIRGQMEKDPALAKLVKNIVHGRMGLYLKWYPIDPTTEDEQSYAKRIATTIVPGNIAEYELLGSILIGPERRHLVLAYDSPIMGEVYAREKLAVISGQGATAAGYLGA